VKPEAFSTVQKQLYAFMRMNGSKISDLVPGSSMTALREGTKIYAKESGLIRESSGRARFCLIVEEATKNPMDCGFIKVEEGGAKSLAKHLDIKNHETLTRNLHSWENSDPQLVRRTLGEKVTRYAPLAWVQIPLITDLILWTAETRIGSTKGNIGVSIDLLNEAVKEFSQRGLPGTTVKSHKELKRALAGLKKRRD